MLRNLTRTIKVIFLSQFLHFASAVNKITLIVNPDTLICPPDSLCTVTRVVAPIKFVPRHCTSIFEPHICLVTWEVVARRFVPRWRQHVSQIVPGRQKLRHAFAHYGLGGLIFIAKFHSTAFNRSAPKTTFIAGPLAHILSDLALALY